MITAQIISGMAHSGIECILIEGTWLVNKGKCVVDTRTNTDLKELLQDPKSSGNLAIHWLINIGNGRLSI
ncbi:hypothetical protein A9G22_08385 [Gilliamella sp. App2-1]|uniref:hypothetical protein n=1 Tax=Gilliamella sp. App2-1 TaxID=3120230 RepID=UPI0008278B13|nr:hypothetical protein [Gilliamella apicola]OCG22078.1 hypothetical protein A9G22_08385 [Gilliamella apicola]